MKALDWVETFEKTNPRFWLVWLPDHISMQEPSHAEVLHNVKDVSFDKIGMRQVASAMYKGVCDEISQNGGSVAIECHSSV